MNKSHTEIETPLENFVKRFGHPRKNLLWKETGRCEKVNDSQPYFNGQNPPVVSICNAPVLSFSSGFGCRKAQNRDDSFLIFPDRQNGVRHDSAIHYESLRFFEFDNQSIFFGRGFYLRQ